MKTQHSIPSLVLILFLQANAQPVGPKPLPPKPEWQGLIGEYSNGTDTVLVLEQAQRLFLLQRNSPLVELTNFGHDEYRLSPLDGVSRETVSFRRDTVGTCLQLSFRKTTFLRQTPVGDDGESFSITPLKPPEELRVLALRASPPREDGSYRDENLVDITSLDSTVRLDVRYATRNNFMRTVFYPAPRAFLQRPAAESLIRAARLLKSYGYGLMIFDAYRPWYVTKMFWDATPEDKKIFVADPTKGSRHNRGCAVDVTLYDVATGKEVEMVSGYDEMSDRAYPDYDGESSLQRWHRSLLRWALESNGYKVYEWEWWHFDYKDWKEYRIGTRTFDQLDRR